MPSQARSSIAAVSYSFVEARGIGVVDPQHEFAAGLPWRTARLSTDRAAVAGLE